jgi:2-oxoglutarate dehydrogenase E2 component (dihydrolipoamide succinyltransferase)
MATELKVPVLPESVSDATVAEWHKKAGESISRDENLVDLETDKVVLEVPSPIDGVIKEVKHESGDTVTSEEVLAVLEEGEGGGDEQGAGTEKQGPETGDRGPDQAPEDTEKAKDQGDKKDKGEPEKGPGTRDQGPIKAASDVSLSPAARRYADEEGIDASEVEGTGRNGQVTKEDLVNFKKSGGDKAAPSPAPATPSPQSPAPGPQTGERPEERVPMTRIRKRIAERLIQSKDSIAMLTSFNEVNLAKVKQMRKDFGENFKAEHDIKLGYMSFFVKAVCNALARRPIVNASVDENDIIYHGYQDISIAVSTDKGLVTPVLRDAQDMSFAEIESSIADFAQRARAGKLTLDDLQGGTFTVTNGGTFGSLLSTPIVNPPQSAILGMHTIKDRAIAENGEVVVAPMMYIAISYDHRIIDGKDAVLFLVDLKEQLENPDRMLLGL